MKKIILGIIIFIIVVTFLFVGLFWFSFLGGRGPAIGKPSGDIVRILEDYNGQGQLSSEQNNTNFPLMLPDGFAISVFAQDLDGPRVMHTGQRGELLVSIPTQGKIVALRDTNGDNVSDETIDVVSDLNKPHGFTFGDCITTCIELNPDGTGGGCHDVCELYVAEEHVVSRYNYDIDTYQVFDRKEITALPQGGRHTTRSLQFISDDMLLVSIGSSCNVCDEEDNRRASIIAVEPETGAWQHYATGLRNSVFMTTHPTTGEVWATEMGRDLLGDDLPPDEINIIKSRELDSNDVPKDYGWPLCYGKNVFDSDYDQRDYGIDPCNENNNKIGSYIDLPAHVAPLGFAFIPHSEGWPEYMWGDLLVAYHGSWNSTKPVGYKVVRLDFDAEGNYVGSYDFVSGWLTDDGALGRPVDILVEPDGVMYISDDKAGVIYRLVYSEKLSYLAGNMDFGPTPLLETLNTEQVGSETIRTYQLSYKYDNGYKYLTSNRVLELSPDKHFIALEADEAYSISFFDVENYKDFENRVPLKEEVGSYPDVGVFVWSPDAKHVAFTTAHGVGRSDLYIYHIDSDTYDSIEVNSFDVCGASCYAETPVWSPDGQYIALLEYDRGQERTKINYRVSVFDTSTQYLRSHIVDNAVDGDVVKVSWNKQGEPMYYIND